MSDTERTHFFRPWNCISVNENGEILEEIEEISFPSFSSVTNTVISVTQKNPKIKKQHEEDDDSESIASSFCSASNYNLDNDFFIRRSCSVNSDDVALGSFNVLNKYVLGTREENKVNERKLSKKSIINNRKYMTTSSVVEWNNVAPSNFYHPSVIYEYSNSQTHLPIQNIYINKTESLSADYTWLPTNYQCVQHAINKLNHQDAINKHIKKMRPKKFKCQYCNIAFSNNGQLKGHLRIHTGERPFKCDFNSCNKSFTRNEELTRHKRIHTGLRPYTCLICHKGFGRKDHLKKHIKIHNRNVYHLALSASAATPFFGFHLAHHPSISTTGIPYTHQLY